MGYLILCKFPLFSTVELNLSLDSKLEFLNVDLRQYFKLFPSSQKDRKLGFVNFAITQYFPIHERDGIL